MCLHVLERQHPVSWAKSHQHESWKGAGFENNVLVAQTKHCLGGGYVVVCVVVWGCVIASYGSNR